MKSFGCSAAQELMDAGVLQFKYGGITLVQAYISGAYVRCRQVIRIELARVDGPKEVAGTSLEAPVNLLDWIIEVADWFEQTQDTDHFFWDSDLAKNLKRTTKQTELFEDNL